MRNRETIENDSEIGGDRVLRRQKERRQVLQSHIFRGGGLIHKKVGYRLVREIES
jgi:hypothetical protein